MRMYLRTMTKIALLPVTLLLLQACTAPQSDTSTDPLPAASLLDRLPGAWIHEDREGGYVFEEYWSRANEQGLTGLGVVRSGNDTMMIEHLAVQASDSGTWYSAQIASQNSGAPVYFKLMHEQDSLVFANTSHDFPQRITYIPAENGHWHVHLDGMQNGVRKEEHLHFSPNHSQAAP
jgi:hypothetical protein